MMAMIQETRLVYRKYGISPIRKLYPDAYPDADFVVYIVYFINIPATCRPNRWLLRTGLRWLRTLTQHLTTQVTRIVRYCKKDRGAWIMISGDLLEIHRNVSALARPVRGHDLYTSPD